MKVEKRSIAQTCDVLKTLEHRSQTVISPAVGSCGEDHEVLLSNITALKST